MAAELPRPGVEVIQVFRSVSPTVITPTLVPCVVGVCKQVVEVLETTSTGGQELNSDSLITLPGFFLAKAATGNPPEYTGLDGLVLALSINNGATVTVTFSDPGSGGLSPASMVSQILKAFAAASVTGATAETVGSTQFRVRTLGIGEFETIKVMSSTSPSVATALGIASDQTFTGLVVYGQRRVTIPQSNFPDPRGNLDELGIESPSIRAFLSLGSGAALREILRTESFLRRGGVSVAATLTGTSNITSLTYGAGGSLDGETFVVKMNGDTANVTTTFSAPANVAAMIAQINAAMNAAGYGSSVASQVGNNLRLTSNITGAGSAIKIISGSTAVGSSSLVDLGFTASQEDLGEAPVAVVDDGNGDAVSPIVSLVGNDFTAAGAAATVEGSVDITTVGLYGGGGTLIGKTLTLGDGGQVQSITFGTVANQAALLVLLNGLWGSAAGGRLSFTQGGTGGNKLVISTTNLGDEAMVDVVSGTALTTLGLTVAKTRGTAFPPAAGDELYVDGAFLGTITQAAPGGNVTQLKLNKQMAIDADAGSSFYIIAKSLSGAATSTRPSADLIVDANGEVLLKHELLRDTTGAPNSTARASVYLQYTAVRKDVTALAAKPGLLRFDSTAALEAALSPISVDNPLALGLYFALLNAPGVQVTGLGVDATSSDSPYGTVEGFARAAEYLEAFEVYAIAPLTHDATVAQVFNTHVSVMSDSENKGERICLFNPSQPSSRLDTLVASGTRGNSTGSAGLTFDTGIANLPALLLNAGLNPVGTIAATVGLFLDLESDSKHYSIESVSGSVVTIRVSFTAGQNDDNFYSTTDLNDPPLPSSLIDVAFAVKIRGASLTNVDGTPDKQGIADTYTGQAQTYLNRRFWQIIGQAGATIGGLEQLVEGFYMCAGIVGMIGQQPPQQSFTNFPMAGFTRVTGTNEFFSDRQLNQMAGGGNYIIVQDTQGAPLISRMALTTDLTSIETRTDSITKVVDFTAKFLRRGLKNFIGRFNITQGFLDSLGHVIQGLLGFLVETGVLVGANLNNILQDEDAPDTVLIDITLEPPYPCNYLRLTLVV